jgi:sarcosine oxidase subunit gamma
VSDRLTALELAGEAAATVLNAGCPLDLDLAACPVGFCARSVLAKAGILLWRTGAQRFQLEIERSFTPYVRDFLAEAGREFGV